MLSRVLWASPSTNTSDVHTLIAQSPKTQKPASPNYPTSPYNPKILISLNAHTHVQNTTARQVGLSTLQSNSVGRQETHAILPPLLAAPGFTSAIAHLFTACLSSSAGTAWVEVCLLGTPRFGLCSMLACLR